MPRRVAARPGRRGALRVDVVTLFPELFAPLLEHGPIRRARAAGSLEVGLVNPRRFAAGPHRKVDDRPYGGGPGMVLMPEPLYAAIKSVKRHGSRVVLLSPQGRTFSDQAARRLSRLKRLILVCGRYEGVDARLSGTFDEEISIGDYVLSGGEPAAIVLLDAVSRLVPGAMGNAQSGEAESFAAGLLDHPAYTRPPLWRGQRVPEILLSGDHSRIAQWRLKESLRLTREKRPDLLAKRRKNS